MLKTNKSYRRSLHEVLQDVVPQSVIDKCNRNKSWKYGYNAEYDFVCISKDGTLGNIIIINGLKIGLPKQPKYIRFQEKTKDLQKWRRYEVPKELIHFDKLFKDEPNPESKLKEVRNRHSKFIQEDITRKFNGDWFMNDGEPIYITGHYYFFLQHYKLTDMRRYGDFRMPQRDYFIWIEACFADERCIGSLLLKSRRSSFSTSSGSVASNKAITYRNGFFPIVSKKDTDAQTLFDRHIVKPFLNLPKHLQPQRTGEVNPKKELIFSSPKRKLTTNNKNDSSDSGLDTLITFYATTIDAYDGTQATISINDEIGKMKGNLDINEYWEQAHKMCHIVGSKVVGKALCGSTANPPNKGGKNYEKFYNNSKLSTRDKTGFTKTGLYSIFIPADYSTMGFFDEWGYPIYDNPAKPIKNELGDFVSIGVKEFLDNQELACGDDIKKLNSQKRNNPRVDTDAFLDEDATNLYATTGMVNLNNFLKEYKNTPKYKSQWFRCNFVWKDGKRDGEVEMVRNENGRFEIYAPNGIMPIPKEMRNSFNIRSGKKAPLNGHIAAIGVDPYTANRTQYGGSRQGIVGTTTNHHDLPEPLSDLTWLYYNFRGETFEEAVEDVIKCAMYFSIPILVETNKDALIKELNKRDLRFFLLNNPFKKGLELTPDERSLGGIYTSGANTDKQEEQLVTYFHKVLPEDIDENNIKCPFIELNEHATDYTRENRKSKDAIVAWQLSKAATYNPKFLQKQTTVDITVNSDIKLIDRFNFNNN